ncbi:hypothetical protein R3P38DRAFT_3199456 [Favolaschia claudopus]|uniref:Uncharacterized protein n=1 Tax=Favolaschia claudopus TaxID=2862362 RepID=A0AAW0B0Z1_9AGAR
MAPDRTKPSTYFSRITHITRRALNKFPQFQEAFDSLLQWNTVGLMATWCPIENEWIPWTSPMRILKSSRKLIPVAASGYRRVPNLQGPRCPHSFPDPRHSQMDLHLDKVYDHTGTRANFWRASSHECRFYVIIPPIEKYQSQYITTLEEQKTFEELLAFEDEDDYEPDPSSQPSTSTTPSSSSSQRTMASPSTSLTTVSSSSTADMEEVARYLLHGNPRLPRPSDLPPPVNNNLSSYFNERITVARKAVDQLLMVDIKDFYNTGFFDRNPGHHPLAVKPPHDLMSNYLPEDTQDNLSRVFANMQHVDTHVGRAIREFHSIIGVPQEGWTAMLQHKVECDCCECVFSYEGYNSHVVMGRCSTATPSTSVNLMPPPPLRISCRTYPSGYSIPLVEDFVETPSGLAFCEWNSRLGVPRDVWVLLSTSGVLCSTCKLRRSYEAHQAHLKDGKCADPGEMEGAIAT